MVYCTTNLTPS